MTDGASAFGRLYAELLGDPKARGTAAERARLLLRFQERNAKPALLSARRRFLVPTFAGLSAAALIALAAWWQRPGNDWQARAQGVPVLAGAALVSKLNEPLALDFADGSQIMLGPHTEATMRDLAPSRTGLVLRQGRLSARIHSRPGASFRVTAGPYEVRMVNTTFAMEWDRGAGFHVKVAQGSIQVVGADLPEPGVHVAAGEEFSRAVHPEPVSSNPATSIPATATRDGEAPPRPVSVTELPHFNDPTEAEPASPARAKHLGATKSSPTEPTTSLRTEAAPENGTTAEPGWREQAVDGDYVRALAAAEAAGFSELVETSSAGDLLLLANAARYARSAERAKQAYTAIRRRFASGNAARLSAYYLARLSGDLEHQPRVEARWLKTYLAEAPRGELAASARARLIEILRSAGDLAGAQSVARDYLRYHPSGAHAEGARGLLGSTRKP